MKKTVLILISLILAAGMLVGCATDILDHILNPESQTVSGAGTIDELLNSIITTSSAPSAATVSGEEWWDSASSEAGSPAKRDGYADVIDQIADSVVAINVYGVAYDYFNREYPSEGAGSGVIISSDGYILTNCHVISGGTKITVFLRNGDTYDAQLIGQDSEDDLALLKIEETGLTAARFGDSSTVRVGDRTIVIGNPLGELQGSVTTGIVSALERQLLIEDQQMTLMQTDAAINAGNSGGGLFDSNGELIGIVTAKTSQTGVEGLGYFIPINAAKPVLTQLREYGYVTGRPYVGLSTVELLSNFATGFYGVKWQGVYIASIDPGSAADQAGLRAADYLLYIDGVRIESAAQVDAIIESKHVGDVMTVVVYRDNKETAISIEVTVGEKKQ